MAILSKILAIDFDDTLCGSLPECYRAVNEVYGSKTKFEEHDSPMPYHNPEMGTPCVCRRKVKRAFLEGNYNALPVEGVQAALIELHKRGYKIHINGITFGEAGVISSIHFVVNEEEKDPSIPSEAGETDSAIEKEKELNQTLIHKWKREIHENPFGKAKVQTARDLGASVLIDDRPQFLRPIQEDHLKGIEGIRGILFGPYKWCYNDIDLKHPTHLLTYDERIAAGLQFPFNPVQLGYGVERATNWDEVVELITKWAKEDEQE